MTARTYPELDASDALLVVDVQRDFCPGGALAIAGGDEVVEPLNGWLEHAARAGAVVVASRDWHPRGHVSFEERGGPWPEHCVQHSPGAALHPGLRLPPGTVLLSKGEDPDRDAYSAFDGTGLGDLLRSRGVKRVFVGGLAEDVCVRASVLDALDEGFETHLIVEATRPVDPAASRAVRRELVARGALIEPHVGGADAA